MDNSTSSPRSYVVWTSKWEQLSNGSVLSRRSWPVSLRRTMGICLVETIRSRCQAYRWRNPDRQVLHRHAGAELTQRYDTQKGEHIMSTKANKTFAQEGLASSAEPLPILVGGETPRQVSTEAAESVAPQRTLSRMSQTMLTIALVWFVLDAAL